MGALSEIRIDETTWEKGSDGNKAEWRTAIHDLVSVGEFALPEGGVRALVTLAPDAIRFDVLTSDGRVAAAQALSLAELRPLAREYIDTCAELARVGLGAHSPRLEALDIAKRITHDEAGQLIESRLQLARPDHATARRIFTLLVTLLHDTTRIGITPHMKG
jgi:uncharacterized protein (UPF0262 family)